MKIPIVDLFAGPGGLGEGFSSVEGDPFRIIVSAEMEASAHATLRLRAFYRLLRREKESSLASYYRFCNGETSLPFDCSNLAEWNKVGEEAQQLTLGNVDDNQRLDSRITLEGISSKRPWVLIGGPPCQAYSLVGRSRNLGDKNYRAEEDHRHFLYKEYLRIIQKYRPAVFVMENVKGILSASVGGKRIFPTILRDLSDPDSALGLGESGVGYRIYSLSCDTHFEKSDDPEAIDVKDFVVKSEEYGIPQARHRVILLGVREDICIVPNRLEKLPTRTVRDAIAELPALRSKISKQDDSNLLWAQLVRRHLTDLGRASLHDADMAKVRQVLLLTAGEISECLTSGALRLNRKAPALVATSSLAKWYRDDRLHVWLNHESRGHMSSDLRRYAYAAAFAAARDRSPKGHAEFALAGLRPNHENWESGKFSDRFRVQISHRPATTVTSHISKDGHYFIHPDPAQCRSLTVREAARLQTFPDNYFFQGNKTQQFHQVGNAVPPLLALQIGRIVQSVIESSAC